VVRRLTKILSLAALALVPALAQEQAGRVFRTTPGATPVADAAPADAEPRKEIPAHAIEKRQIEQGEDRELVQLARKTLPKLEQHLRRAKKINDDLKPAA